MNQPPGVAQYLRTRCEWAARLLTYISTHNAGSQVVCPAAVCFALDALLGGTPRQAGDTSYIFLSCIIADRFIRNQSYQQYIDRAERIQALHYADYLHDAGLHLFNGVCAINAAPVVRDFPVTQPALAGHVQMIRGPNPAAVLEALELKMRSDEVGMATIAPMLTQADTPPHWTRAFWMANAGTLDDVMALPFRQNAPKAFNGVAENNVFLFDTVTRHPLHYDRYLDLAHMVEFDCVIVPLRSGLQLALLKPVDAALLDVLRLGARGCFMDVIDSALRQPRAPIRLEVPELVMDGGTLALKEVFQGILGHGFDMAIFRNSGDARLGIQATTGSRNTPLRDIFLRSRVRITCEDQLPQGPGGGGGTSGSGGGAADQPGPSGLGGGASGSGAGGAAPVRKRGRPPITALLAASAHEHRGRQAVRVPTAMTRHQSRSQLHPKAAPVHQVVLQARDDCPPKGAQPAAQPARDMVFNESFAWLVFLEETIPGQYDSRHIVMAGTFRREEGERNATLSDTQPSFSQEEDDEAGGSGSKKPPVPRRNEGLGGRCGPEVQLFD